MKKLLKSEFKNINFNGSFILYSFKEKKGYTIEKVLEKPKIISGYQIQKGDQLKTVKEFNSNLLIKLNEGDNNQNQLVNFLSKIKPSSQIVIGYERNLKGKSINREVVLTTENWNNYKISVSLSFGLDSKEKSELAIKEWEDQFYEGNPKFSPKRIEEIKSMILTVEEKIKAGKFKSQYIHLKDFNKNQLDEFFSKKTNEFSQFFFKKDNPQTSSYDDNFELGYSADVEELTFKATKLWKKSLLDGEPTFDISQFYEDIKKDYFFNFLGSNNYKTTSIVKSKQPLKYLYWFGGIAVDVGTITISDFFKGYHNPIYKEEFQTKSKEYNIKRKLEIPNCYHTYTGIGDGLYEMYVGVDRFNKVNKIFIEVKNSSFMGYQNNGYQPSIGAMFPSYLWGQIAFDNEFVSKKTSLKIVNFKREKIFDLKVCSKFILLSDDNPYRFDTTKVVYEKFKKNYPSIDSIPYAVHPMIPIDNGNYPVYLHSYTDKNEEDYREEYNKIVIEDIQGCYLNKNENGQMVFQRKNSLSPFLEKFIKSNSKKAYVDKIDLRDSQSLKEIEKLKNVEILTLCGLDNINDCSPLYKLKKLKTLYLVDCNGLNLKKNNKFKVKIKKFE